MNSQLDDARKKAREELAANGELAGLSEEAVNKRVEASATYKEAEANYGVGSTYWTAGTAVTGLLSGVLGGNIQGGMASGAAPVLARLVKDVTEKHDSARVALHTLVSAALAKAQGGNAVAGGVGGLVSSVSAQELAKALYNKDAEELTSEEKSVVTTLVTALASAGGSVASGDTRGMVSAGNAARVEVENNSLSDVIDATSQGKTPQQVAEERVNAEIERYRKENCAGMSAGACSAKMAEDRDKFFREAASLGIDFVPVVGDFKSFAEADDWIDYTLAAAGTLPFAKVFTKPLKEAKLLLKAGDLDGANKLIKEASDGIPTKLPQVLHRNHQVEYGNQIMM
ncbi:VENN motif-containing pre-toxin protein [Mangrovibacter plantisponsor]|uniref:VENN motif-containing pre-toxin protein n=2 Tax=Mangrovibacter plantisponsor TaxID=451513 RepID=A0A317Q3B8_9ENTR|nr:VENN motif-containing pre-toxin protein [Mangrovibacter plantisponsor]